MKQEPPNKTGAQKTVIMFAAAISFIIVAVFSLILWGWFTPPKAVVEADAGFKKAKQIIDPEQLRAWALESINRWPATNGWHTIPESEIPKNIQTLYNYLPEDASVTGDTVVIFWGGGFFHWALEIGSTNVSRPFNSGNPEYPYNFEWVRGIYYSREASCKLQ
jgi:hypothetical protein